MSVSVMKNIHSLNLDSIIYTCQLSIWIWGISLSSVTKPRHFIFSMIIFFVLTDGNISYKQNKWMMKNMHINFIQSSINFLYNVTSSPSLTIFLTPHGLIFIFFFRIYSSSFSFKIITITANSPTVNFSISITQI